MARDILPQRADMRGLRNRHTVAADEAALGVTVEGDVVLKHERFREDPPPLHWSARMYLSVIQSVPNNTPTTVAFDALEWDHSQTKGGLFIEERYADLANDRFRIPPPLSPGVFYVSAQAAWTAHATGYRELRITREPIAAPPAPCTFWSFPTAQNVAKNSMMAVTTAAIPTVHGASGLVRARVGDKILLDVVQTSGAALDLRAQEAGAAAADYTWLDIYFVEDVRLFERACGGTV